MIRLTGFAGSSRSAYPCIDVVMQPDRLIAAATTQIERFTENIRCPPNRQTSYTYNLAAKEGDVPGRLLPGKADRSRTFRITNVSDRIPGPHRGAPFWVPFSAQRSPKFSEGPAVRGPYPIEKSTGGSVDGGRGYLPDPLRRWTAKRSSLSYG